jgi:hypothetical protein
MIKLIINDLKKIKNHPKSDVYLLILSIIQVVLAVLVVNIIHN